MSNTIKKERFYHRHISAGSEQIRQMLDEINAESLDELVDEIIPKNIRLSQPLDLDEPTSEYRFLKELKKTASKNEIKSHLSVWVIMKLLRPM